ncbi:Mrp/NBP35 family ATP-binding protein [Peptostreptococcus canis]|uniref:Iron-sulfur cluster carrier protein n=1 Tax=Peptostreptococcus canis TaxID=1159213 RepID=A0ABR6TN16_9FIRM|nr:Mrp/NBP35 family ATP-binding protein [Peptostreptococcus canis]MBC2576816.1 Mrp/NBP35 family ATP-binding protein [Peptostreptococcus canis]MBP1998886.1 Mrp family chromosome partitioning ATPase [Peptostreptococcus canis]
MSNCDTCPSSNQGNTNPENTGVTKNPNNKIKNIIGVMSGKGGVGKSTVTTLLARQLSEQGYNVGILDADITGPSIPRLMMIDHIKAYSDGEFIIPVMTDNGIKVVSLNLLIEDEDSPVIWRGPMIGGVVQQFYSEVLWGELDYLLIDMPPGTGDVALTVMQSIPLTGIVMVSIPQNLVSMIVGKAINMANQLKVPVVGVVENMSYVVCPGCSEKIKIFSDEKTDEFLKQYNLDLLGELPMSQEIIKIQSDGLGEISDGLKEIIKGIADKVEAFCKKNRIKMFFK